jgi:hypothetical protein
MWLPFIFEQQNPKEFYPACRRLLPAGRQPLPASATGWLAWQAAALPTHGR